MIVKATGATVGSANSAVEYLGTTGDNTPAHQNPNKIKFNQARKEYNRTGLNKYHQQMMKYKVYTKRDLLTFGNFDTSSEKAIKSQIKLFMSKHTNRKVQTREFVIMPSPDEHIDPNDRASVYRFAGFVHSFVNQHFNASQRPKGYNGYFPYYAVIQPDSHNNSRVHAHIVVVNANMRSGKAMAGHFCRVKGKYGLLNDLRRTAKRYGYTTPSMTISQHKPSRMESRIIRTASSAFQLLHDNQQVARTVTSRPKFIRFMKNHGIIADYRSNRRRYHGKIKTSRGWKFKLNDGKRHAYIKASRISKATGGQFLSTNNIKATLTQNRRLNAQLKHHAINPDNETTPQSSSDSEESSTANFQPREAIQSAMIKQSLFRSKSASEQVSASSAIASSLSASRAVSASKKANPLSIVRSKQLLYSSLWSSQSKSFNSSAGQVLAFNKTMQSRASFDSSKAISYLDQSNDLYLQHQSTMTNEVRRIQSILAEFHDDKDDLKKRQGAYSYAHAIPAYLIGYQGSIPEFNINPNERPLMKRLLSPVINGFKHKSKWIVSRWNAGKKYFRQRFGHVSLMALAKSTSIFKRFKSTKIAQDFISRWKGTKATFSNLILEPLQHAEAHNHVISSSAESHAVWLKSIASSASSSCKAISASVASKGGSLSYSASHAESSLAMNYQSISNSMTMKSEASAPASPASSKSVFHVNKYKLSSLLNRRNKILKQGKVDNEETGKKQLQHHRKDRNIIRGNTEPLNNPPTPTQGHHPSDSGPTLE